MSGGSIKKWKIIDQLTEDKVPLGSYTLIHRSTGINKSVEGSGNKLGNCNKGYHESDLPHLTVYLEKNKLASCQNLRLRKYRPCLIALRVAEDFHNC